MKHVGSWRPLALGLLLALPVAACAPEVDTTPMPMPDVPRISVDDLAAAIEDHIAAQSDEEGFITVEDPVTGATLRLALDEVHRERLSRVGPETYFACADFVSDEGVRYDIDFFMQGTSGDALTFDDLSIHKVEGEARYTWHEEDGVWKKRPTGEGDEHPEGEHPEEEHPEGDEHPDGGNDEHPE